MPLPGGDLALSIPSSSSLLLSSCSGLNQHREWSIILIFNPLLYLCNTTEHDVWSITRQASPSKDLLSWGWPGAKIIGNYHQHVWSQLSSTQGRTPLRPLLPALHLPLAPRLALHGRLHQVAADFFIKTETKTGTKTKTKTIFLLSMAASTRWAHIFFSQSNS